jgi:acyl dehydratase
VIFAFCSLQDNGNIFEVGAGWVSRVRWQRNEGVLLPLDKAAVPETYLEVWDKISSDFSKPSYPTSSEIAMLATHVSKQAELKKQQESAGPKRTYPKSANVDPNVALGAVLPESSRTITGKDCILYALGIGAAEEKPTCPSELRFTYENAQNFSMFPTMGVTFVDLMNFSALPGLSFNPMMLLHGEHYLEVLSHPLPTSGTLQSKSTIAELWDKEKAALVVIDSVTSDESGKALFLNRMSAFIRGIGGWGGERGPKPASYAPPARAADVIKKQQTNKSQALFYRIPSGDGNPLHADPNMAAMGGFDKPILHGLCTFGFACRAVLKAFANNDPSLFKAVNVRFSGHVFPGETIETHMWKISPTRIVFEAKVVERGTTVISNAYVDLTGPAKL